MAELHLDVISTASSKGLDEAQKELKETRAEADKLGSSFNDLEADAFNLEAAIASSRLEVKRLAAEFKQTGDRSLVIDLKRESAWLGDLTKMAAAGGAAGATAGKGFMSAFDGALSGTGVAKPVIYGTLILAAIAAAPTIGAVIGGAVAGGIGTIGVAGGIAMAAKDPEVKAAAKSFGQSISEEFFSGGDAFVRPTVQALAHLADVFRDLKLGETFAKMAPHVTTIAVGIGNLAENTMPGLNKAFERMGPFADAAAEGFGDMGSALSQFMDDVTASEGTVEGLEVMFRIVNNTIVLLGKGVNWLSERFEDMNEVIHGVVRGALVLSNLPGSPLAAFRGELERVDNEMTDLRTVTSKVHTDFGPAEGALRSFGQAADLSAEQLGYFNKEMDKTYHGFLDLTSAQVDAEEALDNLEETLRENGPTMDINTEAGRENVRMLGDLARDAEEVRKKTLEQTGSVDEANTAYGKLRDKFKEMLTQLGYGPAAIEALTNKWLGLQDLPPIELMARLTVIYPSNVPKHIWDSKLEGVARAEGGPIEAGKPYLVGEEGPEWVVPSRNGYVIPNGGGMGGSSGSWGGGMPPVTISFASTGDALFDAVLRELKKHVRISGGVEAALT